MTTSPDGRPGRRERQKAAMRQRLYESAMSLFAEKGYNDTSIDDIAEKADVARATVFNYFKRKDEFLDEWTARRQESLREAITRQGSRHASAPEQLRQAMKVLAAVNEEEFRIAHTLVPAWVQAGRPITEEPYTAVIFADIIAGGIARGEVRQNVNSELVGNVLRDLYLGTLYRWIDGQAGRPFSLRGHLLTLVDLLLEGLAAERA